MRSLLLLALAGITVSTGCATPVTPDVPSPPPGDLTLWASTFTPGMPASIIVEGLDPFERAHFVRGIDLGAGTCIQTAGNLCLDITRTVYMGNREADATGRASFNLTVPSSLPPGTQGWFQTLALRGAASVKSDPLLIEVAGDDIDGDGFTQADDCDDSDPTVYPGAFELCDGIDNDCDSATTEDGRIIVDGATAAVPYALDHALSLVSPGGTIELCAGTYPQPYETIDRSVTIRGQGQGQTILDAGGINGMFVVEHPYVTFESMTLTGIGSTSGDTIRFNCGDPTLCDVPDALVVRDVEFTGNGTALSAPTVYNTQITVLDSRFHDIAHQNGAMELSNVGLTIRNTSITDIPSGFGSAAMVTSGATHVEGEGVTFHRNTGGRAAVLMYSGTLRCTDCEWGAGLDDNSFADISVRWSSTTFLPSDWFGVETVECNIGPAGCQAL